MNRSRLHHEDEIEAAAAQWLARRDAGLTAAERAEFERWQTKDPRHAAALTEFETMWTELGRPRRTGVATAVEAEYQLLRSRRRRRRAVVAAGACVVLVVLGSFFPQWGSNSDSAAPTTAIVLLPEQRTLPDGSIVELREGADITVGFAATETGERRVILHSGEAHFQVAKDEQRPFVVAAGRVAVRAVGTAFSVGRSSDRIDVLVTEGIVAVGKPQAKDAPSPPIDRRGPVSAAGPSSSSAIDSPLSEWRLGAGTRMTLDDAEKSDAPEVLSIPETELNERLGWRSPRVEFSRATLLEVVDVINRYCRIQFKIADRMLEPVRLSGRFRADDAEAFARALERSFGIKVERSSETEILLRRAE